jgi:streptogramin lyase
MKLLSVAILLSVFSSPALADAILSGTVTDAGKKMAGITVTAKADGQSIATSVFTDETGAYYFPALKDGTYRVWAQGTGYAPARRTVALSKTMRADFALLPAPDVAMQMTGDEFLASLPDATPNDKRLRMVFRNECTGCHQPNYVLQQKFDEKGGNAVIDLMKRFRAGNQIFTAIDFHQKELASYLARARGPGPSSMKIKLRPRPSGEAARAVIREYDVPMDPGSNFKHRAPTNNGSDWTLGTPSSTNGTGGVHDVEADSEGNIWFVYTAASKHITLGRVDAQSGQTQFFKVNAPGGSAATSHGIIRDQKGILWFNATVSRTVSWLGRMDPKSLDLKVFVPPDGIPPVWGTLDVDAKGFVWASTDTGILRFDPAAEKFLYWKSPTQKNAMGSGRTYGVVGDMDGNGWTLQMAIDMVTRTNPATGKIDEIQFGPVPGTKDLITADEAKLYASTPVDWNVAAPWSQGPRRGASDKNAPVVWMANFWGGNLGRIDIRTLTVDLVNLPNPFTQQPYHAVVDSSSNVWVEMMSTDQIMRYNPAAKAWTAFDMPTRGTEMRYLAVLERQGRTEVMVPFGRARKVAVMTVRTAADIEALKKAAAQAPQRQASAH